MLIFTLTSNDTKRNNSAFKLKPESIIFVLATFIAYCLW